DVRMTLRQLLGDVDVQIAVAPESQIRRKLASTWSEANTAEALSVFDAHSADNAVEDVESDEGAITAVRQILTAAIRLGATDVHVEPLPDEVRIRMRVDGALRKVMSLPRSGQAPLTSRIKIMANLDIARKRVPQDGRAHTVINGMNYNMRVSTLPTLRGEKVVIRLLTDVGELPTLSTLGLPGAQLRMLHQTLRSPQGLVLITGPTGSGKTTTLYSAINEVVTGDRNLITLEEPVEIELPGVSQVQIDEKAGMTFAAGLRSVLRQDPDIIMVGEIRDQTTAELAIRASLTGHLVLATVHTNDAASAVVRMVDMGVPRYLISSALTLVIAQRLLRKPCPSCVVHEVPDAETRARLRLSEQQAQAMVRGTGCEQCDGLGFKGRTGVYEMLPFAADVRRALLAGGDENALTGAARPYGWRPLIEAGIDVACAGRTTVSEILRVLMTDNV
ncbi:MAG: GspE/PulE family protein, partial [Candidatus Nanopelagicales bacterium]|nr:GspE/PulE family protein [Candidatus Nanopelagicales bacterium]